MSEVYHFLKAGPTMSAKDEARKANADLRKLRLEVSLLVKTLQAGAEH